MPDWNKVRVKAIKPVHKICC